MILSIERQKNKNFISPYIRELLKLKNTMVEILTIEFLKIQGNENIPYPHIEDQ